MNKVACLLMVLGVLGFSSITQASIILGLNPYSSLSDGSTAGGLSLGWNTRLSKGMNFEIIDFGVNVPYPGNKEFNKSRELFISTAIFHYISNEYLIGARFGTTTIDNADRIFGAFNGRWRTSPKGLVIEQDLGMYRTGSVYARTMIGIFF